MNKVPQSQEELETHLREQVDFLRSSAERFDRGVLAEAKRLATAIRVLVHDSMSSISLLSQLAVKDRLRYVDCSHPPPEAHGFPPGTIQVHAGLVEIEMTFGPNGKTGYRAPLGEVDSARLRRPGVSFGTWWENLILTDNGGNAFSRRGLVLGLANMDGGAHVDPELKAAYAALSRGNSLGWTFYDSGGHLLLSESPVLANVRQIAWELDETLASELSYFLGAGEA